MASSTALFRDKSRLRARLQELPASPGIYRFYDAGGSLVYVGKSICLRDRVRSYFTGKAGTTKLRRMRAEIASLDWEQTGSELEALLLESRLIKRHQPRFNVMLRGFVPLPCVRVDFNDPYPRLEITRSPERDGATYFGPFRSQGTLEAAVHALSDTLRLRDCDTPGSRLPGQRPCYRYEFGNCSGPCLREISPDEYRASVENACAVFEGREQGALEVLHRRMDAAAERLQFEIAARLRDAVKHIRALGGRQQALLSAVRELSLVAACPSRRSGSLCLFVFRSGRLVFQEDLSREVLGSMDARREWVIRIVGAVVEHSSTEVRLDAALMDEVQIVTDWMKQRTREGTYWLMPDEGPEALALALDEWLAALVEPAETREPGPEVELAA